jgi:TatD DNase family protein
MFDAHTHVHFPIYDSDRDEVVSRAKKAGVKMITVGTQLATSAEAVAFAHKHLGEVWAAVGFHPGHVGQAAWHHDSKEQRTSVQEKFDLAKFTELAHDPVVVAIGECGLDYYRISENEVKVKEEQRRIFLEQAHLALQLHKPLMIHCRPAKGTDDAYEDLLKILSGFEFSALPKILHFYVGSPEMTARFVDAGYYFTFGGVITFARDYDKTISLIPLGHILLETDAPYVAPEKYRGKRNEPAFIIETAKKMAELKGVTVAELDKAIDANVKALFSIE